MFELLDVLDRSYATISKDLEAWFANVPNGAAWNVVSDYCVGDKNKANDTFAFSVILNHDLTVNIAAYIAEVAPRDLKSSQTVSVGLMQYLKCPVAFSVTYVVARESKLLRDYITVQHMASLIPDACEVLEHWRANSTADGDYFATLIKRLRQFERDTRRANFNSKLARQVHLVAAFAAMLFKCLNATKAPSHIRWISDRDATFDRYDAVAYDLGYVYFLLEYSKVLGAPAMIDRPRFYFELPDAAGAHRFDELIRLPDHLAGTLADIDLATRTFTHPKFEAMLKNVFTDSRNNTIVQVLGANGRLTTRRLEFSSR